MELKLHMNGHYYDRAALINAMDDEIREELHGIAIATEQDFLDAYCQRHLEKYGEQFQV